LINNYQVSFLATTLVSEFSIAIVLGAVFAFAWIPAMSYFQRYKYEYSYAASLSLVFIIYTIVQDLGGSGPIAALMFGLVIANGEDIYRGLNYHHSHSFTLSKESKSFHDLITFFTTSFFFVYFGGLITPSDYYGFLLGIIIGLVLLLARIASTHLALFKSEFSGSDKSLISYMVSRGTGAAVVAVLPISYGILNLQFLDVIFMTILTTIVMNSLLVANYKIVPPIPAS
jgi:NhaP-type Na+/H+ or K+/H+ antiporter